MAVLFRLAVTTETAPDHGTLFELFSSWWESEHPGTADVSERSMDDLWIASAATDHVPTRRRAVLGSARHDGRNWVWLDCALPDHVVCERKELEPAPMVVAGLLEVLDLDSEARNRRAPIFLRQESDIEEAIHRARSGAGVSFFLSSETPREGLTKSQQVLYSYLRGLGPVYVIDPQVFEVAKALLRLRWSNPGMAACVTQRTIKSIPSTSVVRRPEPAGRLLQSHGLNLVSWGLPAEVMERHRSFELAQARESGDIDALVEMFDEQAALLRQVESEVAELHQALDGARLDAWMFEEELLASEKESRRLRWQINHPQSPVEPEVPADAILDLAPSSCEEVLSCATDFLPNLVVTADQEHAVQLDEHEHSDQWARIAWAMLAAINDYVDAKRRRGFKGSIFHYANSPPDDNLPLSTKRIALSESESTEINRSLRRQRTFSVPREVDASGSAYMDSHLKVGNGSPAPRIHFLDASEMEFGRVIIGYFGKHLGTGGI